MFVNNPNNEVGSEKHVMFSKVFICLNTFKVQWVIKTFIYLILWMIPYPLLIKVKMYFIETSNNSNGQFTCWSCTIWLICVEHCCVNLHGSSLLVTSTISLSLKNRIWCESRFYYWPHICLLRKITVFVSILEHVNVSLPLTSVCITIGTIFISRLDCIFHRPLCLQHYIIPIYVWTYV